MEPITAKYGCRHHLHVVEVPPAAARADAPVKTAPQPSQDGTRIVDSWVGGAPDNRMEDRKAAPGACAESKRYACGVTTVSKMMATMVHSCGT